MGWLPSLGGVFMVATEPVECAEAEGNMGLRVGGLLVAMVGLKVTLRAGRSAFLPSRGVDSAVVAMMGMIRLNSLWSVRRDDRVSTHALLYQYEWSSVTEQTDQGTIVLNVSHQARRSVEGWASQLPLLLLKTSTSPKRVRALYNQSTFAFTTSIALLWIIQE